MNFSGTSFESSARISFPLNSDLRPRRRPFIGREMRDTGKTVPVLPQIVEAMHHAEPGGTALTDVDQRQAALSCSLMAHSIRREPASSLPSRVTLSKVEPYGRKIALDSSGTAANTIPGQRATLPMINRSLLGLDVSCK